MDTKKLRQKILDLAIRGKLVPQDPNDEPASVLLERIRAEKERLIKEGKIKRSKKSASDDEIEAPFEIPESWEWVRLEDFVKAITDGDHQPPPQSKTGVPFLVISDVNTGVINFSHARFVSEEYYNNLPAIRRATKGDILFTVTGSYGITILVDTEQNFCFQRHIGLIKTISCSEWITIVLQSDYVHKYCDNVATGTAQKTVSLGHLRDFIIPVPPLSEQQRIVNEVERWFAVIDALESNEGDLLKTIDKAKSKILDLAIHGKLVPQDPNDEPAIELLKRINPKFESCDNAIFPFKIPNSWIWSSFSVVYDTISSKPFQILQSKVKETGKIPVISQSSNYIEGYSDQEEFIFKNSDAVLVFGDHTRNLKYIDFDFIVGADGVKILKPLIYAPFAYYSLLPIIEKMRNRGYARHYGVLAKSLIPIPPINEEHRIVARIEELFAVLDSIKESLE